MIQPVGDKILVRPLPSNISSALEVPEYYLTSEAFGEVVKLGTYYMAEVRWDSEGQPTKFKKFLASEHPDVWPVKVGDKISYSNQPGVAMKVEGKNGKELLLMHIGQVRTVVEI